MLKRTLFFGSPGKLSIKNGLLVYESGSPETAIRTFPVEDIGFLVLESMQLSLNFLHTHMLFPLPYLLPLLQQAYLIQFFCFFS